MITSARRLLRELDTLPYPARQRMLAQTARAAVGTPELNRLLDELARGDRFSRTIALQIAAVAGHDSHVVRCLGDAEASLVRRAIAVAVRLGVAADELAAMLPDLPAESRRALYRACRRHGATELGERLSAQVRARWGDREAAALLAVCAPATVAAVLDELEYAVPSWAALARRHPVVVLDFADRQLGELPRASWPELFSRIGPGIAVAAGTHPRRVLDLLERALGVVGIPVAVHPSVAALARHDRDRVLRLMLDPRRPGSAPRGRAFWRVYADAPDSDLIALARLVGSHGGQSRLLLHILPPRRRAAVYAAVLGGRQLDAAGRFEIAILDELPAAQRHAEAARVLGQPTVAARPRLRLRVTARLDWPAAGPVLANAMRRAAADDRAEAYPLYVLCAAATRDPAVVAEMLNSLDRLPNEQDPVRAEALSAIAAIRPWLFSDRAAEALRTIMRDAAQARDRSWITMSAVGTLSRALLREGVVNARPPLIAAALDGMDLLGQHESWLDLRSLDRDLPRGAEHAVFAALRPRLTSDAARGRYGLALALAAGLGRRAWQLPELQQLLGSARSATDDDTVREAVRLWLAPPATRDQRVETTLSEDRSTITIASVQRAVARRRTDLLDDIFRRPLHGRFLKRGVRYLPSFRGCFDAWLPRQASRYAQLLVGLANARDAQAHRRVLAVQTLGRVPGTADLVRSLLGDSEVSVVEAALAALAWTDEPADALAELLGYASSDRARVAVYAVTRCARFVKPSELGAHLRPLLLGAKVTGRKEAARLVAEHRVPDALRTLSEAWSAPNQHRDARRAIVSASRWLVDDERAWLLLDAGCGDPHTATALLEISPGALAPRHRDRYGLLVLAVADSTAPDNAREGLSALPQWGRWTGARGLAMLVRRAGDLDDTATWRQALAALVTSCDILEVIAPMSELAERLVAELDAQFEGRDQPARQRLTELGNRLRARLAYSPVLRPGAVDLARVLVSAVPRVAVELSAAAVPFAEATALDVLRQVAGLAEPSALVHVARSAVQYELSRVLGRLDPARVLGLAASFAAGATAGEELVALGMAQAAGAAFGWPGPWRALLGDLRRSDHAGTRAAALEVFTSDE